MHHILRGVLGAGLVYPLVWYYYAQPSPVPPAVSQVPAAALVQPSEQADPLTYTEESPAVAAAPPREPRAPAARTPAVTEPLPEPPELRAVRQRVAEVAPRLELPSEPQRPQVPAPGEPAVPFPAFAELQDAFAQMKDLQAVAHDPKALDERVQVTEYDAQKVAKLKALAEQFVELPPPRGERYLPAGKPAPAR